MSAAITGGCQCGAVRFQAASLGRPSICHCRMCQKAFGGFYAPLVTAHGLEWTRGRPKTFASSNMVTRGFCADCGTPLTYAYDGGIEVAIGALDTPALAAPVIQVNPTDKQPFADGLAALPIRPDDAEPHWAALKAAVVSYQHPDHDTAEWPLTR